jgi:uncharacterized protein YbjT (DUF2867 family)
MQVAIVGGTGFVGSHLVVALVEQGHRPAVLVRPGSESRLVRADACRVVSGDLDDEAALRSLLEGCEAAIYNVGILRESPGAGITFERMQNEGARKVVGLAEAAGVQRFLLMSANGVREQGTAYQRSKWQAEQFALASRLDVTVFRPSVIFGDPAGRMEFATQLRNDMVKPPIPAVDFFSAFGEHRGPVRMSPVHVDDVAAAFVAALGDPETIGDVYELGGPEVLTWGDMIRRVADAVGRRKRLLPMPIEVMAIVAALLDWLPLFPVTRDQLRMLAEGNTADPGVIERLIGRTPKAFTRQELAYLED